MVFRLEGLENLIGREKNSPLTRGTTHRYRGYNKEMIDNYVNMGFDVEKVVTAFEKSGVQKLNGMWQPLPEQYHSYVTERLLGDMS